MAGIGVSKLRRLSEEGYRVVVKDRLGWGKSSKPIIPYSISLWASNTARLMDHLEIDQAAIVGHSIGGQMVTRFRFALSGADNPSRYREPSRTDRPPRRQRI